MGFWVEIIFFISSYYLVSDLFNELLEKAKEQGRQCAEYKHNAPYTGLASLRTVPEKVVKANDIIQLAYQRGYCDGEYNMLDYIETTENKYINFVLKEKEEILKQKYANNNKETASSMKQ